MSEGTTYGASRLHIAIGAIALAGSLLVGTTAATAETGIPRNARPEEAQLYIITPSDGSVVSSPVVVRFGLRGMGVAPAGIQKEGTGHHHLVVDADLPPANLPVPTSDHYRHFGMGQTEVTLELPPGEHTLQLLLADQNHVPHDPPLTSERITIKVEK